MYYSSLLWSLKIKPYYKERHTKNADTDINKDTKNEKRRRLTEEMNEIEKCKNKNSAVFYFTFFFLILNNNRDINA